jgi:hypothetical protein
VEVIHSAPQEPDFHAVTGLVNATAPHAYGLEAGFDLTFHMPEGNHNPYGHPNAWVYVPHRFDHGAPLELVVVFHGFLNCLASYTSVDGIPCTPGHPKRTGYDLARQIERSGIRAIVVIPQLSYDERNSDPGKLGEPNALHDFLAALIERELAPVIGPHKLQDVSRVAYMASSGGYQALEPALELGNVPNVRDIYLLDAYYMYEHCNVEHWIFDHLAEFDPSSPHPRRFSLVYTAGGGALDLSLKFKGRAHEIFTEDNAMKYAQLYAEEKPTLADLKRPITIVRAKMEHDEIVGEYFWRMLAASGL